MGAEMQSLTLFALRHEWLSAMLLVYNGIILTSQATKSRVFVLTAPYRVVLYDYRRV